MDRHETLIRGVTPRRLAAGAVLAASCVWIGAAAPMPLQDPTNDVGEEIDGTRAALERWVETRRLISRERRDWEAARELLTERIEILKANIEDVRNQVVEKESEITGADRDREQLISERDALQSAVGVLETAVPKLEQRVRTLLKRVPAPLREKVRQLSQELPEEGAETELSLSRRYQNVIGILNEVDKFNREILVTPELRDLPDGSSAEVTVMYLGLGQAYYVGPKEKIAGVGTATADGWVWTEANDAAPQIALAIAIFNNEEPAAFVSLPVRTDEQDEDR